MVNGVYKPTYNWGAPSCRFHGMAHWLTNLVSSDGFFSDILSLRESQLPHPAFLCLSLGQSYMDTLILNSLLVWEYLRSPAKNLSFFAGYLADWQ